MKRHDDQSVEKMNTKDGGNSRDQQSSRTWVKIILILIPIILLLLPLTISAANSQRGPIITPPFSTNTPTEEGTPRDTNTPTLTEAPTLTGTPPTATATATIQVTPGSSELHMPLIPNNYED